MFRVSDKSDSQQIAVLVNSAYRPKSGTEGWTHESELVRGERITAGQVAELMGESSVVLVAEHGQELVGCVHVEIAGTSAYIGMLAIEPMKQNTGLGKDLLNYTESYAKENFDIDEFKMVVVSQRKELIDFYVRRGYKRTGEVLPYPVSANVGTPILDNLTIETLLKAANKSQHSQP